MMHTSRLQKALSILANLAVFGMETVAIPLSWSGVQEQMFLFYTELSNLFAMAGLPGGGPVPAAGAVHRGRDAGLGPHPQVCRHLLPDADLFDGGVCAGPHVWPRRPLCHAADQLDAVQSLPQSGARLPVLYPAGARPRPCPGARCGMPWCLRCCTAVWCWPPTLPKCIKDPIRSCMFTSSRCGSRRCGWWTILGGNALIALAVWKLGGGRRAS